MVTIDIKSSIKKSETVLNETEHTTPKYFFVYEVLVQNEQDIEPSPYGVYASEEAAKETIDFLKRNKIFDFGCSVQRIVWL